MGIWQQPVDYAVDAILEYVHGIIYNTLDKLMESECLKAWPRIVMKHRARAVARTTWIKTYMFMCNSDDYQAATMRTIKSLNLCGLHMSVVPHMVENLVEDVVRYDVLLLVSMMAVKIGIPRLDLVSVLEFLCGRDLTNQEDKRKLRQFAQMLLTTRQLLPDKASPDGASVATTASVYVSSETIPQAMRDGGDSVYRHVFPASLDKHDADQALLQIAKRIYKSELTTLNSNAMVPDEDTFHLMLKSVIGQRFDIRKFFDHELSAMGDLGALFRAASPSQQEENRYGQRKEIGPMFVCQMVNVNRSEYAVGVDVFQALLFLSLIDRPRRDYGVVRCVPAQHLPVTDSFLLGIDSTCVARAGTLQRPSPRACCDKSPLSSCPTSARRPLSSTPSPTSRRCTGCKTSWRAVTPWVRRRSTCTGR